MGNLSVFDDLDLTITARLALERALVVIAIVRLNSREPHRCAAFGTFRMFDFLPQLLGIRVLHVGSPFKGGSAAVSLSHRRLRTGPWPVMKLGYWFTTRRFVR